MMNLQNVAFGAKSPAYVVSNECVREIVNFVQPAGKTALSVAGSGDFPLTLTAYDALCVDTFDISYNARVIMDIKTYMLRNKTQFVQYLHNLKVLKDSLDITSGECGEMVCRALTPKTLQYVKSMRGQRLFLHDDYSAFLPSLDEFKNMQSKIVYPYNFVWTDLFNLSGHIENKTYDIVYLSNVLQYVYDDDKLIKVLTGLTKHLNQDGTIVVDSLLPNRAHKRMVRYNKIRQNMPNWANFVYDSKSEALFLRMR